MPAVAAALLLGDEPEEAVLAPLALDGAALDVAPPVPEDTAPPTPDELDVVPVAAPDEPLLRCRDACAHAGATGACGG